MLVTGGPRKHIVLVVLTSLLSQPVFAIEELYRGPALLASIDSQANSKPKVKPPENFLEPEDQVYREYFSGNDASLLRSHQDMFRYHQERIRYAATEWRGEFLTMASLDTYGRAQRESDVRDTMARDVLKARLRLALHTFLSSERRPKALRGGYKKLTDSLEKAKNVAFDVSEENGPRSELRAGYDVYSDAGKIEFTSQFADAGLYHPSLTGALTGSAPLLHAISLSLSPVTAEGLPRPSVGYTLFGQEVSTGLSRQFGSVSTSFVRTTPIRGDSPSRYEVRLGMTF